MALEQGRFRFGPLERRGLIAGWRGGQLAAVGSALVMAALVLRSRPSVGGLAGAGVAVAIGAGVACWPIRGRTAEQWLPVCLHWVARRTGGGGRVLSGVPAVGATVRATGSARGAQQRSGSFRAAGPVPPAPLEGCALLHAPVTAGGRRLGVVRDLRSRTFTAALAVRGQTFALLGPDEQRRRVAAWATVLAGLAREASVVHRIQWLERSFPDDGRVMARYLDENCVLGAASPAASSYRQLLERAGPVTRRHEVVLALSVRLSRSARRAPGPGDDEKACLQLERELRSLQAQLETADLGVEGILGPSAMAAALWRAFDARPRSSDSGSEGRWPWPLATEVHWSSLRTDGTWHATYWVAEWPRIDVGPDFLSPLLLQSAARRTVSVTMEPVSPSRAVREVEHARTADVADAELRRRGGFVATARRRKEEEGVTRQESELAEGHAQYRFSGYLTVTAPTLEALEAGCGETEQAAARAHLELRRMYGEQDEGFACTLPLGRGLS